MNGRTISKRLKKGKCDTVFGLRYRICLQLPLSIFPDSPQPIKIPQDWKKISDPHWDFVSEKHNAKIRIFSYFSEIDISKSEDVPKEKVIGTFIDENKEFYTVCLSLEINEEDVANTKDHTLTQWIRDQFNIFPTNLLFSKQIEHPLLSECVTAANRATLNFSQSNPNSALAVFYVKHSYLKNMTRALKHLTKALYKQNIPYRVTT